MVSSTFVIEPMTTADLPEVAIIDASAFHRAADSNYIAEELARPWAWLWVARESLKVIAYLVTWHVADEIHVLNVATHPDHRRQGVARALMDHIVSVARNAKARNIILEVRLSNIAAIQLYRTMGFYTLGIRRRYYPDGEDAVDMMLTLDPDTGSIVRQNDEVHLDV